MYGEESPRDVAMLRCRKCRKGHVDSTCLYPIATDANTAAATCSIWHVNVDRLPEWILTSVHQAHWTVGKLYCQCCGARLGGFNFMNRITCPCGQETTVHLSKSRVDHDRRRPLRAVGMLAARRGGGGLDRSEVREDPPASSPFCRASVSRLDAESRPLTAHLDALWRLTGGQVSQSVPCSVPYTLSRRKGVRSNESSRLDLETPVGLSQTIPVDLMEGDLRCWEEERSPRSSAVSTVTRVSPVCRERGTVRSEDDHAHPQQHSGQRTPEGWVQLVSASPLSSGGRALSRPRGEEEEDEEEEEEEVEAPEVRASSSELHVQPLVPPALIPPALIPAASPVLHRLSKREKNRLKSQRRKQRRRERWIHSQLEKQQSVSGVQTDSEEEDREGHTCAVCLDVYYSPYSVHPCGHVFCEPCLRTLARDRANSTPCPLCRTLITHTLFHKELNQTAKTFFPKIYHSRKQNFQKALCAKWPLPNGRKRFRIFWGERRATAGRAWHFAPAGFTLDTLDLDMRGWLFDIDLVIIYVHSVHWVLALLVLGLLAFFFFFSS